MNREPKIGDTFWCCEHGDFIECRISDIKSKFSGVPIYCGTDKKGVEHGWYLGPLPETMEECDKEWVNPTFSNDDSEHEKK